MTADLQPAIAIIATPGETTSSTSRAKPLPLTLQTTTTTTSPSRKVQVDAPNPQQGMADPSAASVSANTAVTATNTACTSPLTVTSLEASSSALANNNVGGNGNNGNNGVPHIVSQVVPGVQQVAQQLQPEQQQPLPSVALPLPTVDVESMLAAPMAKLGLGAVPAMVPPLRPHPPPPPSIDENKMCIRTPPTEHDNRKLFVGGLPTDVKDGGFLEFFQQYGEVIDSVVMVDRVTKRSRGFGFVTFASEEAANSLLTIIPGKTGYVVINGKQCEVKASTPKVNDGSGKHVHHHHGAPGMWRSNPPHRHEGRGYRHQSHAPGPMKHAMHHQQPRGEKHFYIDNEYNGDVDGRNFDDVNSYSSLQMNASYQTMNTYGRNPPAMSNMYHQNYQNVYPTAASSGGYMYSNSSAAGASVPSSYEASYPAATSQGGYRQYPSSAMSGNNGYYDAYALHQQQQQYSNQLYGNQYTNSNSTPPPMMVGQAGYTSNSGGYYAESGAPMPYQGTGASDGGNSGFEPYPQSYAGQDQAATADQYE